MPELIRTLEESEAWHPEHPGWSIDILPFYSWLSEQIPKHGVFVEVGVFLGRSLRYMAEIRPDVEIWGVDPWLDGESQGYTGPAEYSEYVKTHGGLFRSFVHAMPDDVLARVKLCRGELRNLSLRHVDAIFIDGAHDYESVRDDIENAQFMDPRIIAGHDYSPDWKPEDGKDDGRAGVIRAVDEAFGKPKLIGTCWYAEEW